MRGTMTPPVTGGRQTAVRLGLAVPRLGHHPGTDRLDHTLNLCTRLDISVVDISMDAIETELGVPAPTVPLEPPPTDGVSFGLLELEEDVLRDAYDLARQSFDAQVRAWRLSTSVAPLAALTRPWQAAGIGIDMVTIPYLAPWTDEELDYACRVARSIGAHRLSTPLSIAAQRRLTPMARHHGILLSFVVDVRTTTSELDRLLASDEQVSLSVDVGAWTKGAHGSLLVLLEEHAARISHARLRDTRHGGAVTFGSGDAPIREVLQAIHTHRWSFPALIEIDPLWSQRGWNTEVAEALDYCRTVLT